MCTSAARYKSVNNGRRSTSYARRRCRCACRRRCCRRSRTEITATERVSAIDKTNSTVQNENNQHHLHIRPVTPLGERNPSADQLFCKRNTSAFGFFKKNQGPMESIRPFTPLGKWNPSAYQLFCKRNPSAFESSINRQARFDHHLLNSRDISAFLSFEKVGKDTFWAYLQRWMGAKKIICQRSLKQRK